LKIVYINLQVVLFVLQMVWGSDFMLMGQYASAYCILMKQFSHGVPQALFYTLHQAALHIHF